jgi:hypothetical protein
MKTKRVGETMKKCIGCFRNVRFGFYRQAVGDS